MHEYNWWLIVYLIVCNNFSWSSILSELRPNKDINDINYKRTISCVYLYFFFCKRLPWEHHMFAYGNVYLSMSLIKAPTYQPWKARLSKVDRWSNFVDLWSSLWCSSDLLTYWTISSANYGTSVLVVSVFELSDREVDKQM